MIVGFTGTREGLSQAQLEKLKGRQWGRCVEAHHGDCVGADARFHDLMLAREVPIVVHPPKNPSMRANCLGGKRLPEKGYRERNMDIVKSANILVACPLGPEHQYPRSGTWSTIRMAQRLRLQTLIIWRDGRISFFNPQALGD